MVDILIAAEQTAPGFWNFDEGDTAELRIAAQSPFRNSEGVLVPSGNIQNRDTCLLVPCVVNPDKSVSIPDITELFTTFDSIDNPNAVYIAGLFPASGGNRFQVWPDQVTGSGFSIQPNLAPATTWSQICLTNTARYLVNPPQTYLNLPQLLLLGDERWGEGRDASAVDKGLVYLDVPPDDATHPIAVGVNSPLVTPADASTTVKGVTKLSVAPVSATNPIAVGQNDYATTDRAALTRLSTAPVSASIPIAVSDTDPRVNPNYAPVLNFPGSSTRSIVNHGQFWPTSTALGHFFWNAQLMPRESGSGYFISDGYGGSHAILFGFNQSGSGAVNKIWGSSWNGANQLVVNSDDGLAVGEWGDVAFAFDGSYLYCYINGVLSGKKAWTGTRTSPAYIGLGGGHLFVGGSDHNNFDGRIAYIRGWEGFLPFSVPNQSFKPETIYTSAAFNSSGTWTPASFFADYTKPGGRTVVDLSPTGYNGSNHPGTLMGTAGGIDFGFGDQGTQLSSYPLPQWVYDPTAPAYSSTVAPTPPAGMSATPPAVPVGAVVYDSFTRANQTFFLSGTVSLGNTEGGSAGVKTWTTFLFNTSGSGVWGILSGNAVCLGDNSSGAFVETGTANMDVRVSNRKGSFGTQATGLTFRYQNFANLWYCEAYNPGNNPSSTSIRLGYVNAGAVTSLYDAPSPVATFTTLRVVTSGTNITVYVDDGASGWVLVQGFVSNIHQTQTKAGILSIAVSGEVNGLARCADFTVF